MWLLLITILNLILTAANLWIFFKRKRPYNQIELEQAAKNWRSNLNFKMAQEVLDAQIHKIR